MSKQTSLVVQCGDCQGTGLKREHAHDGAAYVCRRCKGTGKSHLNYTPFDGKQVETSITRVFAAILDIT